MRRKTGDDGSDLPSYTVTIDSNVCELPEDLAGSFFVARERAKTGLDNDVPCILEGRCEVRETTKVVHCAEEGLAPSAEPRN